MPSPENDDSRPSETPSESFGLPHPVFGWLLIIAGVTGAGHYYNLILTRKSSYSMMGPATTYTLQDNLRSIGPVVLLCLFTALVGVGVLRRWRWVRTAAWLLSIIVVLILGIRILVQLAFAFTP